MATIKRFEDIKAWQKARELTRRIYQVTGCPAFRQDWSLRDQIRRAAVSVMSNIAEGFERGGDREFIQFLSIAKGSTGEIRAQLYVALDAGLLDQQGFQELQDEALATGSLVGGFMKYLQESKKGGVKFK
jgi:four helix bundle protein